MKKTPLKLWRRLSRSPPHECWDSEELFFTGDEYFSSLFSALTNAKKSIWLESYILYDDEVGRQLIELLCAAGQRGVDVRLHIDAIGSREWIRTKLQVCKDAPIGIRIFNSFPNSKFLSALRSLHLGKIANYLSRANRRTHRKFAIIDGELAYVGSSNLCAEGLKSVHGDKAWQETVVAVKGSALRVIIDAFERSWRGKQKYYERFRWKRRNRRNFLVRDNSSPVKRLRNHLRFLRELKRAKSRIYLTTAYFLPGARLCHHLCKASKRGVDVCIIVPSVSDVFFMPWVSRHFYAQLIDAGVRIFEFQGRMIHSKTSLIDNYAWVGSSNLNNRSVYWDSELDIRVTQEATIIRLVTQFKNNIELAIPYQKEDWITNLAPSRLVGLLLLRFSRLM